MHLRHRRLSTASLALLLGASACFEDPVPKITTSESNEESGDGDTGDGDGDGDSGDGDTGDGDGDSGDGDGDSGDGDGDGDSGDGDGDGDGDNDCPPGESLCSGICVDTNIDPSNCGECGTVCAPMTLCGVGMCKPEKYVFATDGRYQGNLGAVVGDAICMQAAADAGLPGGIYRAWISTNLSSPGDWPPGDGVYRLRQGEIVAYSRADLFDGSLNAPINRTEYGEPLEPTPTCDNMVEYSVWTGTTAEGAPAPPDCQGWTTSSQSATGRIGNAAAIDVAWSSAGNCTAPCSTALPIYCIQQ